MRAEGAGVGEGQVMLKPRESDPLHAVHLSHHKWPGISGPL